MKISNPVKIGLLALITFVLGIVGYNFLNGKDFFSSKKMYYAKFKEVGELTPASPVKIKGLVVGSVAFIQEAGPYLDKDEIIVGIQMKKNVKIPTNAEAFINTSVLGVSVIEIKLLPSNSYLSLGDTITSNSNPKILEELQQKINPVLGSVNKSLGTLDTLLRKVSNTITEEARANLNASLYNVSMLTQQLNKSALSLQQLLNSQSGTIANTLKNVEKFSKNLNENNQGINNIVSNLNKTTDNFSKLKLDETLSKVNLLLADVNTTVKGFNNPNGSLGKIMNDKLLYDRLNNTIRSVNVLIDDLKTNPKRYVNISVFGKKNKGNALQTPIINADSSLQIIPNH
jgi:phospholipid/cholesterol/gamma-HCH transport system substrate-binding protein